METLDSYGGSSEGGSGQLRFFTMASSKFPLHWADTVRPTRIMCLNYGGHRKSKMKMESLKDIMYRFPIQLQCLQEHSEVNFSEYPEDLLVLATYYQDREDGQYYPTQLAIKGRRTAVQELLLLDEACFRHKGGHYMTPMQVVLAIWNEEQRLWRSLRPL